MLVPCHSGVNCAITQLRPDELDVLSHYLSRFAFAITDSANAHDNIGRFYKFGLGFVAIREDEDADVVLGAVQARIVTLSSFSHVDWTFTADSGRLSRRSLCPLEGQSAGLSTQLCPQPRLSHNRMEYRTVLLRKDCKVHSGCNKVRHQVHVQPGGVWFQLSSVS